MATELEKIVMQTDVGHAQNFPPNFRHALLGGGGGNFLMARCVAFLNQPRELRDLFERIRIGRSPGISCGKRGGLSKVRLLVARHTIRTIGFRFAWHRELEAKGFQSEVACVDKVAQCWIVAIQADENAGGPSCEACFEGEQCCRSCERQKAILHRQIAFCVNAIHSNALPHAPTETESRMTGPAEVMNERFQVTISGAVSGKFLRAKRGDGR